MTGVRWRIQTSRTTSLPHRYPPYFDPCNRRRTISHTCTSSATPSWNEQNCLFCVNRDVRNAPSTDVGGLHCQISRIDNGRFVLWLCHQSFLEQPRRLRKAICSRQQGRRGKVGDAMRMMIRTTLIAMTLSWTRLRQQYPAAALHEPEACAELQFRRKQP